MFFLSILALTFTLSAVADNTKKIAAENFNGSQIRFSEKIDVLNATLTISGPNGFSATSSDEMSVPQINLFDFGEPSDGRYKYHITSSVIGEMEFKRNNQLNNGRSSNMKAANKSISQSGHFLFENGQVKHFDTLSDSNNITRP